MRTLLYRINTRSDGSIQKVYVGYRCLHRMEGGYDRNPLGDPEVRPSFNVTSVEFDRSKQQLSFALNAYNTYLTKMKWRSVYANNRAFTNENGFDDPSDPRADYINNLNIGSKNPQLMKGIICGGMFIRGERTATELICYPGIHGIDANGPVPDVQTVMRNNWYFVAVTSNSENVYNFPQGGGQPVIIPYFIKGPTPYPIEWFEKWEQDYLPEPTKVYR